MGVFARLLGRSKATPEASDASAPAGTEPAGAGAERTYRTESAEAREAGAVQAAETTATTDAAGNGRAVEVVRSAAGGDGGTDTGSEGAGIPRQQSAGEVADSAAGEDARR
ncbi:hypothetical protein [Streptomyces sp. NRRL S-31]|uniref:hypothetical protein n=1 Tax=Streptomyces sp. NRRL S-31 TaxID=1463898 RepID=UPI0004C82F7A|nr:hypothetical protein [Streptomyces sp. NRRL S-31]